MVIPFVCFSEWQFVDSTNVVFEPASLSTALTHGDWCFLKKNMPSCSHVNARFNTCARINRWNHTFEVPTYIKLICSHVRVFSTSNFNKRCRPFMLKACVFDTLLLNTFQGIYFVQRKTYYLYLYTHFHLIQNSKSNISLTSRALNMWTVEHTIVYNGIWI